jgi:hypothetical protein
VSVHISFGSAAVYVSGAFVKGAFCFPITGAPGIATIDW